MVKINAVKLEGYKLILENAKGEKHILATLGAEPPEKPKNAPADWTPKNELLLHLVCGDNWSGDVVAELPEGRVLVIKGSIFSRTSALAGKEAKRVGKLA